MKKVTTVNYNGIEVPVFGGAYAATVTTTAKVGGYKICRIRGTDILIALLLEN